MYCLARLYDSRFPIAIDDADLASSTSSKVDKVEHPLALVTAEGPRPDPKFCLQRLRALWLLVENRSGEINNDPVLPFRHQSALLQFLTGGTGVRRALIADAVGLGKTVEAGLYIRQLLRQSPGARILYVTLGGLVENVLEEFQRLDLPRWYFYANIDDAVWKKLNASPVAAITEDTRLVVASIHKLFDSNRWQEQHQVLAETRFDLIIVDECHALRAYGETGDSPQVWFRNVRQLLQDHLVADGRVLFLSATPHQGNREVFLNLISLCIGTPLNADEKVKAAAARGKVIFRVKEQVRDWEGKRIFPPREVREPRLAEPPANYRQVLEAIAQHFDLVAQHAGEDSRARAVGFVKSQALQYAASSLRAGFAYLLRRLIRYHPEQAATAQVGRWAQRLLPYRKKINGAKELIAEWIREFGTARAQEEGPEGELSSDVGPNTDLGEVPALLTLLGEYDALFDDREAGAKFNVLFEIIESSPEPIVVFSQAVDTVYELQARLEAAGYEVYRLTGDMDPDERSAAIKHFRTSDNQRRLLLSSAAGGVGINLQVARVVVHFDLPWNPMVLEQRVGRVHRIGSTRTILVETILLRGSREAEVFARITERLRDIVRDLSADPVQREALFRRILASLDAEALRDILTGEESLDAVGAAVDAGRHAVDEADRYMQDLAANTSEHRGRATMEHLINFLRIADPDLSNVGNRVYAVLTEAEGGELRQVRREAYVYRFDDEDDEVVFDRTAASYLGLRRDQTGGLGHARVDPILRASIDLGGEAKARCSSQPMWLMKAVYDAQGRETDVAEVFGVGNGQGGTVYVTGDDSRVYDDENHLTSEAYTSWNCTGTTINITQSMLSSPSASYVWGPNNHPIISTITFGTSKTESLHWSGDQLLFTTDSNGHVDDIKVGALADYVPGAPASSRLTVWDRDLGGSIASAHNGTGSALWGNQPIESSVCASSPTFENSLGFGSGATQGFAMPSGLASAFWSAFAVPSGLFFSSRSDSVTNGFLTFQGSRVYDPSKNDWMTPDALAGSVSDPASQRAYAYDRNSPFTYSDPSGFKPDLSGNPDPYGIQEAMNEAEQNVQQLDSDIEQQDEKQQQRETLASGSSGGSQSGSGSGGNSGGGDILPKDPTGLGPDWVPDDPNPGRQRGQGDWYRNTKTGQWLRWDKDGGWHGWDPDKQNPKRTPSGNAPPGVRWRVNGDYHLSPGQQVPEFQNFSSKWQEIQYKLQQWWQQVLA